MKSYQKVEFEAAMKSFLSDLKKLSKNEIPVGELKRIRTSIQSAMTQEQFVEVAVRHTTKKVIEKINDKHKDKFKQSNNVKHLLSRIVEVRTLHIKGQQYEHDIMTYKKGMHHPIGGKFLVGSMKSQISGAYTKASMFEAMLEAEGFETI
jgi:hypothetical protein